MRKLWLNASAVAGCGLMVLAAQEPAPPAVFTAAQADGGKAAYQSTCGKCHTATLLGRTGKPGELPPIDSLPVVMQEVVRAAGGNVPPLAGADFLARWEGQTTMDLSVRIKTAIGGFPPEGTGKDTYLDLTAYILQANGAQSGTQALTGATAVAIGQVVASLPAQK
jgi:hypothetical protein